MFGYPESGTASVLLEDDDPRLALPLADDPKIARRADATKACKADHTQHHPTAGLPHSPPLRGRRPSQTRSRGPSGSRPEPEGPPAQEA